MRGALERGAAAALMAVLLGACSGGPAGDATPATPPTSAPLALITPPSVSGDLLSGLITDHIVRDSAGSYFCVLRRGDDLASLRREFNGG